MFFKRYFCYFLENYLHILWLIPIQHSARRVSKTSLGATPSYFLCNWTCFLFSWNIWLASQECRSHTGRLVEQTQHQSISSNQWNLEQITSEMQIIKINTREEVISSDLSWVKCINVKIENKRLISNCKAFACKLIWCWRKVKPKPKSFVKLQMPSDC